MKLSELGLKSKPQTKYFEGGYVSFSTVEDELLFKIYNVTKKSKSKVFEGRVGSIEEYQTLMSVKTMSDVIGVQV